MTGKPRVLHIDAVAERLGDMPVKTLYDWRARGVGPESFKLGQRVVYREDRLEAWIEAQEKATRVGGS